MPPRFSRPRLIDASDKQYRTFVQRIMLGKDNQRPTRPPRARELFGGEAEAALRQWLGQQRQLSERRIVEYFEHRGRSAIKKYRELDAVALRDQKTIEVYEIKASRKATSLRRASHQLHETRTILGMLYPRVCATIMLVDTGVPKTAADVAALMAEPDPPSVAPPTLDEVLATLPHIRPSSRLDELTFDRETMFLMRFSVEDIIALVGAEHLHLDWDEEDEEDLEEGEDSDDQADEPRYAYTTDAEEAADDDESPLAAALRKAMQSRQ